MSAENPFDRLDMYIAENRLIRNKWTDGHDRACLLAALSPECGAAKSSDKCPAELMPPWFARITPWIDDAGSLEAWPGVVRRYAQLGRRWHVLTAEDWTRLDYRVRALCVREAMWHTEAAKALAACETVASLCEAAGKGETIGEEQLAGAAAAGAANAAAIAAAEAAAGAANAAAIAAAEAASWAAGAAAAGAAWAADRLTAQILDAIEAAVTEREGT